MVRTASGELAGSDMFHAGYRHYRRGRKLEVIGKFVFPADYPEKRKLIIRKVDEVCPAVNEVRFCGDMRDMGTLTLEYSGRRAQAISKELFEYMDKELGLQIYSTWGDRGLVAYEFYDREYRG